MNGLEDEVHYIGFMMQQWDPPCVKLFTKSAYLAYKRLVTYMSHVILQKLHQTIKPCLSLNTKTMFTHDMLDLVPLFAICTYDMNSFMSSKYHIVEGQAQHGLIS